VDEQKYVTVKDLAEASGFSNATVSLALRNHPRISKATKEKVWKVAEEMNYHRHPMVSALMANVRQSGQSMSAVPLAAVYTHTDDKIENNYYHRNVWEGMEKRAADLGFKLERFYLDAKKITGKRMTNILKARGIEGIVIPTMLRAGGHMTIEWDEFSVLSIGYSMLSPNLHRICSDHYRGIRMVLRELKHLGYKRPGLVLNERSGLRSVHLWSSGFFGFEYSSRRFGNSALLECETVDEKLLLSWYRKYKPDVIISSDPDIVLSMEAAGLSFPEDVGLVCLQLNGIGSSLAGIDQNEQLIGAKAIENLVQMIYFSERGVPDFPLVIQIPSVWRIGDSVKQQS
jgi:DNA-binding LacI/PurR family transcriptional regulator